MEAIAAANKQNADNSIIIERLSHKAAQDVEEGGAAVAAYGVLSCAPPFVYHSSMKLDINTRGNGACPLCSSSGNCRIHKLLATGVGEAKAESAMELVVYCCPYFSEKESS